MKFALFYFTSMLALYVIASPVLFLSELEIGETTALWFLAVVVCYPFAIYVKRTLRKI